MPSTANTSSIEHAHVEPSNKDTGSGLVDDKDNSQVWVSQGAESPSSDAPSDKNLAYDKDGVPPATDESDVSADVASSGALAPRPEIVNPKPSSATATYIINTLKTFYEANPFQYEKLSQIEVKYPGENPTLPESENVPAQIATAELPTAAEYPILALSTLPLAVLQERSSADLHSLVCVHIALPTATPSMVYRFTAARKYDIEKAIEFLEKHLVWRLTALPVHYSDVEAEYSKLKYNIQGKDKQGRYIVCINGARMGSKTYDSVEVSVNALLFGLEKLSNDLLGPTEKFAVIFNNYEAGYSNIDLEWTKRVAHCLQHNYPERLGCCVVAPANLLMRGVWRVAKYFFDPLTVDKIHLVPGTKEIDAYVDKEQRIELLDGTLVESVDLVGIKGTGCSEGVRGCQKCNKE